MQRARFIAVFLAIVGFVSAADGACDCTGRPQNPMEQRLFATAADGRLDELSPLAAAMIAGGVEDADSLLRYERKVVLLVEELRGSGSVAGSPREKAEAIFAFLHRRVLHGGYDLSCTDLRRVLDEGRFNCVSATVLFNHFAAAFGLDCRGLEMPGHAMSRVQLPGGAFDVETTCPGGFHGSSGPQCASAASGKTIGAAAAADRAKAREVSPVQMAAMIYYNRGVDFLSEKRFAEAAACNAKSLRLDPTNATARGNLLATINNWAIALGDSGHFAEAVELLRQGLAMDSHFEAFAQNFVHVHHQWADSLCGEGRFEEALSVLSRAATEMPRCEYLHRAQDDIRGRWAKSVAAKPPTEPWIYVKNADSPD